MKTSYLLIALMITACTVKAQDSTVGTIDSVYSVTSQGLYWGSDQMMNQGEIIKGLDKTS